MKFIIASPNDPADLTTFLLRHKHSILSLTHDLQELAELIRKHAPHGIFICGPPDESFAKRAIEMVTVVPNQCRSQTNRSVEKNNPIAAARTSPLIPPK
jgi:hypothetical protein